MEAVYIFLGWLLGLLSPTIIDAINLKKSQRLFFQAIKVELMELQFRVCLNSFLLAQRYGNIDKPYLKKIRIIFSNYNGSENIDSIKNFIDKLIDIDPQQQNDLLAHLNTENKMALSLKTHPISLLDSSPSQISALPLNLQSKIYELKNVLHVLNEEILVAKDLLPRTFDSSLSEVNHMILTNDLMSKYKVMQVMCDRVCEKIQPILEYEIT